MQNGWQELKPANRWKLPDDLGITILAFGATISSLVLHRHCGALQTGEREREREPSG